MPLSKVILFFLLLCIPRFCVAGLSAFAPMDLANKDTAEINRLVMQTGCAIPDLSDSAVDGTAVVEISFTPDGKPIEAQIISSNGSASENAKIIEAFTKRCKYTRGAVNIPLGATKQFKHSWKAHQKLFSLNLCRFRVDYPPASIRLNEEGQAVVSYRYLADGSYESKISQSTGFPRLDEKTLANFNACLENHALPGDPDITKWSEVAMNWKIMDYNEAASSTQQSSSSSITPQN